jgi:hypothetical protein
MSETDQPIWLKIMEHGAAGEARTKAFLLDRFWVLERSVDIDGADFLIQPRSLADRFTDRAPPKVGVVQAKYFQDHRTTHYIPRHYVLDDNGKPLKGFFAILHLGTEDAADMFLLSADEIHSNLDLAEKEPWRYIVGAKSLDEKYRVTSRRLALDKIAHEIAIRSSLDAFLFLDQVNVPYRKVSEADIEYSYTLPIPNTQTDIPKSYLAYRNQLRSLQYEMEEALVAIDTILKTSHPRAALAELKKLEDHRDGGSHRGSLTFGGYKCDLDWPYFEEALDEHERRVEALTKKGLLEKYVELSYQVKKEVADKARPFEGVARDGQSLWASLDYDPDALELRRLDVQLLEKGEPDPFGMLVKRSHLMDHGGRHKISISESATSLWHGLMSAVLKASSPGIDDHED